MREEMSILDEMLAESEAKAFAEKVTTPPTVKDVLLKTWDRDTEAMAYATIDAYYDDEDGWFSLPDGFGTDDPDKAVEHYIAYLNSAAEVGK